MGGVGRAAQGQVDQMFELGDKNRDGLIDFADFKSLMETHFRRARIMWRSNAVV